MAKKAISRNTSTKSGSQGKAAGFGAKSQDVDAAWGESRKKERDRGGFGIADIPDGDYILQLTSAKTGVYKSGKKKGMHYYNWTFTIKFGDHAGTQVRKMHDIDGSRVIEMGGKQYTPLDLLKFDLDNLGVDTSKIKSPIKDGSALCQSLAKEQPINRGTVKTKPAEKVGQQGFQSVYINDPVSDDELAQLKEQFGTE